MAHRAKRFVVLGILMFGTVLAFGSGSANELQGASSQNKWAQMKFLFGKWSGFGKATPGQGPGGLEFVSDLDGSVLKAISKQEFPATDKHPAFTYESMMIISSPTAALFLDNEGHVLHNSVRILSSPNRVIFTSKPEPYSPRFRLTYTDLGGGKAKCVFEIAPYGSKTYTQHAEGTGQREK